MISNHTNTLSQNPSRPAIQSASLGMLVLILLLAALPLHAETPVPQVAFRVLAWDEVISDLFYSDAKGQETKIMALPNGRSSFYSYEGEAPVSFYRKSTGPNGETLREEAASVPVGRLFGRQLLIFMRDPATPGKYRIEVLNDSDEAIPVGAFRFINLTDQPLSVFCGGSTGEIKPRGDIVLRATPREGEDVVGVEVQGLKNGKAVRLYSNRWAFSPTLRGLVFVSQSPGSAGVTLKKIQEDAANARAPKPPEPPAKPAPRVP